MLNPTKGLYREGAIGNLISHLYNLLSAVDIKIHFAYEVNYLTIHIFKLVCPPIAIDAYLMGFNVSEILFPFTGIMQNFFDHSVLI